MKNLKYIFILISFLLIVPSLVKGYTPTNDELKSSIFDYIGTQSLRQQQQDIIDGGNKANQQLFNTYYQTTNNLQNEYNLKLKELQMKQDAQDRADAWQKEKTALDQQLELINQNKALQVENDKLKAEQGAQDLIQFSKDITEQIIKEREKSPVNTSGTTIKPFKYETPPLKSSGLPVYPSAVSGSPEINDLLNSFQNAAPVVEPIVTKPIEVPTQRKNIFYRFWDRIISFF